MTKTTTKNKDTRAEDFKLGTPGVVTTADLQANKAGPRKAEQPIIDMDEANKVLNEQRERIEKLDAEIEKLKEEMANEDRVDIASKQTIDEQATLLSEAQKKISELEITVKELDEAVTKLEDAAKEKKEE